MDQARQRRSTRVLRQMPGRMARHQLPMTATASPIGARCSPQGLDEPMQKQWSSITGRYQSPAEFAKAHLELRNTAIFVPKDDAKPEAWDQVYDRPAAPKDAKDTSGNHLPDAPPLDEAEQEVRNGFAP